MAFLLHLALSTIIVLVIARLIPGIVVTNWRYAVLAALALGFVNAFIRPVLAFVTLPITVLTLGLFHFVINALMFKLAAAVVPGFSVDGCLPAILGSLLLSVLNLAVFGLLLGV